MGDILWMLVGEGTQVTGWHLEDTMLERPAITVTEKDKEAG